MDRMNEALKRYTKALRAAARKPDPVRLFYCEGGPFATDQIALTAGSYNCTLVFSVGHWKGFYKCCDSEHVKWQPV